MKVLVVCSYKENYKNNIASFIDEQVDSLQAYGIVFDFFLIQGKGLLGYLRNRKSLIRKIREFHPDLIHAHYGLSGLLANLQRCIPVITTYHGSDINDDKVFRFSKISICLSAFNIFVSNKNKGKAKQQNGCAVIPCGVDTSLFQPIGKDKARAKLDFLPDDKLVLFAGAFDNKVKNPDLGREATAALPGVRLIELKGYSREEVVLLMNAVDAVLMTSFTEGSPQFIKEAMACNCPVVSVDVGDVKEMVCCLENCYITSYNSEDVKKSLQKVLNSLLSPKGRERLLDLGLDESSTALKIKLIYDTVLRKRKY